MLEIGLTHSPVAKLSQSLSLAVCKFLAAGLCEPLIPDVIVSEAHQYNHNYVLELSGPTFDSLHKNLGYIVGGYMEDVKKLRGWALVWGWALAQDNTVLIPHK